MNTTLNVMYHTGACQQTINQLVAEYALGLVAAAQANADRGQAEEAFLFAEAHVLVVGSKRAFQKKGLDVRAASAYAAFGMPADCALAQTIRKHTKEDPARVIVDAGTLCGC